MPDFLQACWWLALQAGISLLTLLAVGNAPARKALAGLLAGLSLVLPWLAPQLPVLRVLLALLSMQMLFQWGQIAHDRKQWPWRRRLWSALVPFDVRRTRRVAPLLDARLLFRVLLHALLAVPLLVPLVQPGFPGPAWRLLQLLSAAIAIHCLMDAATGLIRLSHRLVGIDVPEIQRDPLLSLSLREFWGRRWNRPVQQWFNEYVFTPLARRGQPALAPAAVFGLSAVCHGWLVLAVLGVPAALMMASFFVLQYPLVAIEPLIRQGSWPVALRRLWTIGLLLASSLLFVLPVLQGFGLWASPDVAAMDSRNGVTILWP